jgi:diguanylate cyclase (GGDEF)-like protein/PAS domain S-box-containing protein
VDLHVPVARDGHASQSVASSACAACAGARAGREDATKRLQIARDHEGDRGIRDERRSVADGGDLATRSGAGTGVDAALRADAVARVAELVRRGELVLPPAQGDLFREVFRSAPAGLAVLDLRGRVQHVNPELCTMTGRRPAEMVGRRLPWLAGDEAADAALAALRSGVSRAAQLERPTAKGEVWVTALGVARDARAAPDTIIAVVSDDSERRRSEDELRYIADHDGLTGLLNRRGFEHALAHHLTMGQRYGHHGALVLLDVDHFKEVNDGNGHHVGDRMLIEIADVLRARLRESDAVARLGGDEFAVLLTHADGATGLQVAEEIVASTRGLRVRGLRSALRPTLSAGIVAIDDIRHEAADLMISADRAMYASKKGGRDRVTSADDVGALGDASDPRVTLVARIEQAVAAGRLQLDAQPVVDLAMGNVVEHELFVRLPSPAGPLDADRWMPLAERQGFAEAIDAWVLTRAFDLLASGAYDAVSINVSSSSIRGAGFSDCIAEGIRRTGVDPGRITVEMAEGVAMGDPGAAIRFVDHLRAVGCSPALDDVGVHLGALARLRHTAFDEVKIDGSLLRDPSDDHDRAVVRGVLELAASSGCQTTAEGIEDAATLAFVRGLAIQRAQGYHVGRPEPVPL